MNNIFCIYFQQQAKKKRETHGQVVFWEEVHALQMFIRSAATIKEITLVKPNNKREQS